MSIPVLLLVVEDQPADAELTLRELRRAGFEPLARRVETEADFLAALEAGFAPGQPWELVLADYHLPQFTGVRALQLLRARSVDLPFILISGAIGEDVAVEAMRAGADDYLLKDRLTRLGPAVTRALDGHRLREAQRQAEEKYRRLFEDSVVGIYQTTPDGQYLTANPVLASMFGYDSSAELMARVSDLTGQFYVDPGRQADFKRWLEEHESISGFESEIYRKDGSTMWVSENARAVRDAHGALLYYEGTTEDITSRKQAEQALHASEERYRGLFEDSPIPLWEEDYSRVKQRLEALRQEGVADFRTYFASHPQVVAECAALIKVVDVNKATLKRYRAGSKDELIRNLDHVFGPTIDFDFQEELVKVAQGQTNIQWEGISRSLAGDQIVATLHWSVVPGYEQSLSRVILSAVDITERKRAEEALRRSEERYRIVSELASDFAYAFAVGPSGELVPEWITEAFTRLTGFTLAEVDLAGGWPSILYPADVPAFVSRAQRLLSGQSDVTEYRTLTKGGEVRWLRDSGRPVWDDAEQRVIRIFGAAQDITERKRAEQEQRRRAEQFALLYETGLTLNSALDSRIQLETVFDVTVKTLRASRADFFRYDAAQNELRLEVTFQYRDENVPASLRKLSFPLGQEQGLVGWVGQQRQSLNLPDVTTDPRWIRVDPEIRSALWVPVQREQQLLGVLCLLGSQTNAFSEDDQRLLELIASQVAVALENARLFEETHQRLAELEAVNQVSKALRTAQTLDEMLPVWLDITLEMMRANGGSIWLYDPVKDELQPAVIHGWVERTGAGPVRPQKPGVGVSGYVFVTGRPYVSSNFQEDPHSAEDTRARIPPGGGAGIPIRVGDQVIGTFVVNVPLGRELTPAEVHLLTTLAEIAGSAIQRMRFYEKMEQRLGQLSALRAIDEAISASVDLKLTLAVFLDHLVTQLGVDAADVLLLDTSDQMLSYEAGRGFRTRQFQQERVRVGEGRAGRAVLERRIVVSDLHDAQPAAKRTGLLASEGFASYIGVPLIAKGQVRGVLEVFHRRPLDPAPEWLAFLSTLAGQAAIALDNAALFDSLQRSNTDLRLAYDATIEGWSRALDLRDKETEGHSRRVTMLTEQLALAMGLSKNLLLHVRRGALLHDIGKMGVPDHILLKPGPLTDDEWAIMHQHPTYAYEMLAPIVYLRPALDIPYCHHEKWDGTGYPRGLKGEAIPLAARIFTVVDVWDALRSDRPYRRAWPAETVREHIRSRGGTHFDPAVAEAFLSLGFRDER